MSDNKKYYYLKLKENFFDSEEMIILQNMQDGYLYSDILLKLYLRSLKSEGKLMFKDLIPYTPSVLAQVVRHQVGTVEKALNIFQELGLIDVLDNGAIYMSDIQNFIGKSSTEADRKRDYRKQIEADIKSTNKIMGHLSGHSSDKNPPEIEIELEIDTPKDKKPTCEFTDEEMQHNFKIIYDEYPRKEGKTRAYAAYRQWIMGKKVTGIGIVKLTNEEMLEAVTKYTKDCLDNKRETKYIKHASTFFNNILDFVG